MEAPRPVKYYSRRGAQSATWTLPGMRGLRIRKQDGYWQVGYDYYTLPWKEEILLHQTIQVQRFSTLYEAVQAAWVAAEVYKLREAEHSL